MLTYNEQLAQLVHCLRVDPFDVVLQNAIADLIEQHGKPGMENRTTKFLRNGKIPPGMLDRIALQWLSRRLKTEGANRDLGEFLRTDECLDNFGVYLRRYDGRLILDPHSYYNLWRLANRYRKACPHPKIVKEAERVNAGRIRLLLQRRRAKQAKLLGSETNNVAKEATQ